MKIALFTAISCQSCTLIIMYLKGPISQSNIPNSKLIRITYSAVLATPNGGECVRMVNYVFLMIAFIEFKKCQPNGPKKCSFLFHYLNHQIGCGKSQVYAYVSFCLMLCARNTRNQFCDQLPILEKINYSVSNYPKQHVTENIWKFAGRLK